MNKRSFCSLAFALVSSYTVLASIHLAQAQGSLRVFPDKAELGVLVPRLYPEVALDGKLDRLSAGSLIRDLNNRIVLLNSLNSQEYIVSYTREAGTDQIQFVWILNQAEFEREKERIKQKRRAQRDGVLQ